MLLQISGDRKANGEAAAALCARRLNLAIAERGEARLLLSTGASQFEMFEKLVNCPVDWTRVSMFHLDEYVGLSIEHKASFRKYLAERFASKLPLPLKAVNYVDAEGSDEEIDEKLAGLSAAVRAKRIDVGVIGIGENGHIAFNDPPADFETQETYKIVKLDDRCKKQQVGEGWFETVADVPAKAVSMTVNSIMNCRCIISCVPGAVKAEAIKKTFETHVCPEVPATMLKLHDDWTLFCDVESASGIYAND